MNDVTEYRNSGLLPSSAGWQPAVSPTGSRLWARLSDGLRIANPRYGRLSVCATLSTAVLFFSTSGCSSNKGEYTGHSLPANLMAPDEPGKTASTSDGAFSPAPNEPPPSTPPPPTALTASQTTTPPGTFSPVPETKVVPGKPTTIRMPNRIEPQWLRPPTNLFTLGPGDKLELELIGETNSNTQTLVCPDGKIYFNVLQGVDVWGRTLSETKTLVEQELAQHIRNGPKVSVNLRAVQSQRVWLLGRVQAPGVYPLNGPTTLLEALAGAGGTLSFVGQRDIPLSVVSEDLADLQRSFIIRNGRMLPVDFDRLLNRGDMSQNIYVMPDDFIFLTPLAAKEVYVFGAVGQPRPVPYTEDLTMVGAIAGAYGMVKDSYERHVAIVRGSLAQPEVTIVDYRDVVRGKVRDIPLKPRDIVYVPWSPYRYIEKYIDTILNTFVSSVAINGGSWLVLRQPQQGGVFIPVGSRITVQPPLPPVQ